MDRFLKRKRKNTPEPPQPPIFPAKPIAGPSGFQAEEDTGQKGDGGSQIVRRDQVSETWLRSTVIDGIGYGNEPTTEGPGNSGIGRSKSAERSGVSKRTRGTSERFDPLKVVLGSIPAACANDQEAVAFKCKIERLLSRIVVLENRFDSRPTDVAEQRRRDTLRRKFEAIEEQLRSLAGMPEPRIQVIYGVLEELRETVFNYQMVQQMEARDQLLYETDPADATVLNNFRSAQGAEYRHGNRNRCLEGTRGAVLEAIEHWTGNFDRPPVYWLNGLAGTGKTTIAQTIAERTFADGQLGASFFCSRDFQDRRNLQLIFPTIAVQLTRKYTPFRSIFIQLVRSDPEIAHESLYRQMHRLIVQPLKASGISTVIIVDALDECDDQEPASAILSVLGQFVSEIPTVKFLITGRPEPCIWEGFRLPLLAEVTDVFVPHNVEPKQVDNDIRMFFTHEFSELARRRRGLGDWPTNEQLDLLCRRAAGLFVYAAATVKFIDKQSANPIERLTLLLQPPGGSEREARTKFNENTTLDSLYTSVLKGAFGGDNDPDNDPKVRLVLGAVILAVNPISPSSIATLLGLDADRDVFPLLSSAQSLLVLQDIDSLVRPFHKSFPDFITDQDRCTDQRFYLSPPHHHSQLLISCLDLIGRTLEKNICKLSDGVANSDVNGLKERAELYIDPALRYACRSWHTHLVEGHATSVNALEIANALRGFLERKFLFWLEALSLLGAVRIAVDALRTAADWLEGSPTFDLADDCFRFVIRHFEIIKTSSPHIYHSALLLTPRESIVQKLYKSYVQPFVRVVCEFPAVWDSNTAAATPRFYPSLAAWSPCNKFIAIAPSNLPEVDILDSTTLQRLHSLEFRREIPTGPEALAFSPDGRMLTSFIHDYSVPGERTFVTNWDLQTGGIVNFIERKPLPIARTGYAHITYSRNGNMVAVLTQYDSTATASIYDAVSGLYMHDINHGSHKNPDHPLGAPYMYKIWTHEDSLRFATAGTTAITIWEVGFTPKATPTEVKSLPVPDTAVQEFAFEPRTQRDVAWVEFHPALCRLAFVRNENTLMIWDARASKFLLHYPGVDYYCSMRFSPDGRSFACTTLEFGVCLWRESPTGYILFEKLSHTNVNSFPHFTPDGESILTLDGLAIRLWRTEGPPAANSSVPARALQHEHAGKDFILEFLPDRPLAVAARSKGETVMVFDLESGTPQLTIDTSIELCGLKFDGDSIVVITDEEAIAWYLPEESLPPDSKMDIEDSTWSTHFGNVDDNPTYFASISPDSLYIALIRLGDEGDIKLQVYCTSTERNMYSHVVATRPWFAPGGREIWCTLDGSGGAEVFTITEGALTLSHTRTIGDISDGSLGCPWGSELGYKVTTDGWVLSGDGKRLLMLPPLWQCADKVNRVWHGKFLALLHGGLPEPVILELEP